MLLFVAAVAMRSHLVQAVHGFEDVLWQCQAPAQVHHVLCVGMQCMLELSSLGNCMFRISSVNKLNILERARDACI